MCRRSPNAELQSGITCSTRDLPTLQSLDERIERAPLPQEAKVEVPAVQSSPNASAETGAKLASGRIPEFQRYRATPAGGPFFPLGRGAAGGPKPRAET